MGTVSPFDVLKLMYSVFQSKLQNQPQPNTGILMEFIDDQYPLDTALFYLFNFFNRGERERSDRHTKMNKHEMRLNCNA